MATQGYITPVKKAVIMSFKTHKEELEDPGDLMMSDFAKFNRPQLLHLAYQALALYTAAERIILHLAAGSPMCAALGDIVALEIPKHAVANLLS